MSPSLVCIDILTIADDWFQFQAPIYCKGLFCLNKREALVCLPWMLFCHVCFVEVGIVSKEEWRTCCFAHTSQEVPVATFLFPLKTLRIAGPNCKSLFFLSKTESEVNLPCPVSMSVLSEQEWRFVCHVCFVPVATFLQLKTFHGLFQLQASLARVCFI